jgi:hypothetical protein
LALAQAQLFPLRRENTRLSRENQQLHVDTIRQRDEVAAGLDEQRRIAKRLETDIAEMKYLSSAKDQQLALQEKEMERLRTVSFFSYIILSMRVYHINFYLQ